MPLGNGSLRTPTRKTRNEIMKGIIFAIAATLLGTLAYIMIGVSLASAS